MPKLEDVLTNEDRLAYGLEHARHHIQALDKRAAALEEALRDCVVLAAAQTGGLAAVNKEDFAPHHKEIINRAQRLLGGRELP